MSLLEHKKLGFCELKDLKPLQWSNDIIQNYEDIPNSVVNDVQEINRFIKNYWLCAAPIIYSFTTRFSMLILLLFFVHYMCFNLITMVHYRHSVGCIQMDKMTTTKPNTL
jgi:hypothetical protein